MKGTFILRVRILGWVSLGIREVKVSSRKTAGGNGVSLLDFIHRMYLKLFHFQLYAILLFGRLLIPYTSVCIAVQFTGEE